MNDSYKLQSAQKLLSAEHLELLTPQATKLYVAIWNLMAKKGTDNVWISDRAASFLARTCIDAIPTFRDELAGAGLFKIKLGKWPSSDQPNICNRYEFAASEATQD